VAVSTSSIVNYGGACQEQAGMADMERAMQGGGDGMPAQAQLHGGVLSQEWPSCFSGPQAGWWAVRKRVAAPNGARRSGG